MSLPKPSSAFTIPSVHDDLELDCRVYYPRYNDNQLFGRAFAIVAHPYATLGGSYDDPVVGTVAGTLLQHGVTVGTFNFRFVASVPSGMLSVLTREGERANQPVGLAGQAGLS